MNIKFSKIKPISEEDIDNFSKEIGFSLSDDLKKFFIEFNGSKPGPNFFNVGENNESGINEFIPITKIKEKCKYLHHVDDSVIPIAFDECGNYVVVDLNEKSSVYFWDHEEPHIKYKLANSIYEFIDKLQPYDPDSIELEEGQIESAWIDPDFLKSLK